MNSNSNGKKDQQVEISASVQGLDDVSNKAKRKRRRRRDSSTSSSSSNSNSSSSSSSSGSGSSSSSSTSSDEEGYMKAKKAKIIMVGPDQVDSILANLQSTSSVPSHQKPKTVERESVVQFLMRTLELENEGQLNRILMQDPNRIYRELARKQVTANYAKTPILFRVEGLTRFGADRQPAFKTGPTVAAYIGKKQNITLKYPHWPCLIQRGGGQHESYYPIELLHLNS